MNVIKTELSLFLSLFCYQTIVQYCFQKKKMLKQVSSVASYPRPQILFDRNLKNETIPGSTVFNITRMLQIIILYLENV